MTRTQPPHYSGHISGVHRPYVLRRHDDVSGISGTGPIAYALDLGDDGVLQMWDTHVGENRDIPTHGLEWLPGMTMVERIHGHNGATTIESVVGGLESTRLEHLLALAVPRLARVVARLGGIARIDGGRDPRGLLDSSDGPWGHNAVVSTPWRVGAKLRRTLYAQAGCQPGVDDVLLGLMETPHLAAYVASLHNQRLQAGGAA